MEKSNETKIKLLEGACAVFREKGYEKAKVSDIVSHANVAQGTFYLYFKSKIDCLNMLILELIESFLQEIEAESSQMDEDSIYRVTAKIKESIHAHADILTIMHFEQANLSKEVIDKHIYVHTETVGLVKKAFIARGLSDKSADIKTKLVDALIKQHMMNEVYIFNPDLVFYTADLDEMVRIIVEEVNC